jgi:hypothetical protein
MQNVADHYSNDTKGITPFCVYTHLHCDSVILLKMWSLFSHPMSLGCEEPSLVQLC